MFSAHTRSNILSSKTYFGMWGEFEFDIEQLQSLYNPVNWQQGSSEGKLWFILSHFWLCQAADIWIWLDFSKSECCATGQLCTQQWMLEEVKAWIVFSRVIYRNEGPNPGDTLQQASAALDVYTEEKSKWKISRRFLEADGLLQRPSTVSKHLEAISTFCWHTSIPSEAIIILSWEWDGEASFKPT